MGAFGNHIAPTPHPVQPLPLYKLRGPRRRPLVPTFRNNDALRFSRWAGLKGVANHGLQEPHVFGWSRI